jgi:hypothetical protein
MNSEVTTLVEPGAGAETPVRSAESDILNLTKSDVVVFCAFSKNVYRNNSSIAL